MRAKLILASVALTLAAAPASSREITLVLNDDEQRGIIQMLDAATRAGGLQNAETAIYFLKRIQALNAPPPSPPAPDPNAEPKK